MRVGWQRSVLRRVGSLRAAVLAGMAVLLLALGTAALTAAVALPALHRSQDSLMRSAAASKAGVALLGQYVDAETGVRGYVLAAQPVFLEPYDRALAAAPGLQEQLTAAAGAQPDTGPALQDALRAFTSWQAGYAAPQLALVAAGRQVQARAQTGAGKRLFDGVRVRFAVLQQRLDRRTTAAQATVRRREDQLTGWLAGALAVLAVLVLTGSALLLRGVVRPLARLSAASKNTDVDSDTGGGAGSVAVGGPVEVRQLAAAVEGMRARLGAEIDEARRAVQALTQHSPAVAALRDALAPARHRVAGVDVAARLDPAEGVLAGDWYDTVEVTPHRLALVLGDVAGHGPASAVFALRLKTSLAAALRAGLSPAQALGVTAADLDDVAPELFATALVAVIDTATGTLTHANAGHPAALLLTSDPDRHAGPGPGSGRDGGAGLSRVELAPTGPLLSPIVASWAWGQHEQPLHPGDTLLAYTDGITETRGGTDREQYGTTRLLHLVAATGLSSPARLVQAVAGDTAAHAHPNPPADDRTVLCAQLTTTRTWQ